MKVIVTGREVFGPACNRADLSWGEFVAWSGLTQLEELVSLDPYFNVPINGLQATYHTLGDLMEGVGTLTRELSAGLTSALDFPQSFNLLATVVHQSTDEEVLSEADFEFLGYDIVHQSAGHSILVQLGWLAGAAFSVDVNRYGLLRDKASADIMLSAFRENYPEMGLAQGSMAAVWRHKTIGRDVLYGMVGESAELSPVHS